MQSNLSELELRIKDQEKYMNLVDTIFKLDISKDRGIYIHLWKHYMFLLTKLTENSVYGNH